MTRSEAEEFILITIQEGDSLDIRAVMEKYRDKSLREALIDYFFEIDPFGDHLDEIVNYENKRRLHGKTVWPDEMRVEKEKKTGLL